MPRSVIRYSNTVSGGAAMSIESLNSAMIIRRARLDGGLERCQLLRPEIVEIAAYCVEPIGPYREEVASAVPSFGDQTRPVQHPEMVRRGLLGQGRAVGDLADGLRLVFDQRENAPAVGVGQGAERRIHAVLIHPVLIHTLLIHTLLIHASLGHHVLSLHNTNVRLYSLLFVVIVKVMSAEQNADLARAYIEAVGRRDLAPLDELIADDAAAKFAGDTLSKEAWLVALLGLLPILIRNEIRHVGTDGDSVSVVYDFVTDTPAGAVPCVELVGIADGKIKSIELILDQVAFAPVDEALRARA